MNFNGVSIFLNCSGLILSGYLILEITASAVAHFSCTLHHMMIFAFILSSLIWERLRVSSQQSLPATWIPVQLIICAEVILLHLLYFFSTTDQYLIFSWFYHVNYSDQFYETKYSRQRFASTNRKMNGKFDCVFGRWSFSLRGKYALEWIDSIEDSDSMKVDGTNPLFFSFDIFHGHSITKLPVHKKISIVWKPTPFWYGFFIVFYFRKLICPILLDKWNYISGE